MMERMVDRTLPNMFGNWQDRKKNTERESEGGRGGRLLTALAVNQNKHTPANGTHFEIQSASLELPLGLSRWEGITSLQPRATPCSLQRLQI